MYKWEMNSHPPFRLKMDCLKFTSLTVGVLCIIINLSYCQERKYNSLNTGNLNDSTPVLKSIVDSNASITEDVYKLIPEIEEELNKLTRDEFKHFLEKVLLRLKNDYNMILEVYRNITLEEEEEKDNSNNSTLIKRVKRTFKKKQPYCNSCQQGYGQSSFVVPIPVFVKPSYYGQGGCQGGCGNQRPSYPQCNTCGGGGYGGGGYGGGYGGPPSGSYSQSSSSAQSSSMSFGG
ncbi:uncharacterized protein LOC142333591 [Lycorma delicatula]|uniref:uncharacterized protein LOC142333591 n=1 Tax=Lycorma delicatula TaxID=130591 RepID=UPI003F51933D